MRNYTNVFVKYSRKSVYFVGVNSWNMKANIETIISSGFRSPGPITVSSSNHILCRRYIITTR